ncbi:methyltransferase [Reichenbachiella sp. MALMAid0571]|uniref:tRNA1(Val) (adenine(37)-N6)-methyltransferase n=1 Tax=Reichenbachiella sp. MALMAid0571 TaxID=3143939 RepID=UPI0032DFA5B5
MGNSYFQFKQFRIEQGDCAMKVTTEGCILGAWVSSSSPKRILDIGSGTGLLSLMLAQRYACPIEAVEIDKLTANQAQYNFQNSKWKNRLTIHPLDIKDFVKKCDHSFDLIISNPPFFKKNFKSENVAKNLAIHDQNLPQEMLLMTINKMLNEDGHAFVIYPEYEANQIIEVANQHGLYAVEELVIKNKPGNIVFRKIVEITKKPSLKENVKELHIRNKQNEFTEDYIELLKPFYLHL